MNSHNKTDKVAVGAPIVAKHLLNRIHIRLQYLYYSLHLDPQNTR